MGGSSKSNQTAEGDVNFNNVDYGQGGGSSPLKNFNVGRDNDLSGASFEITDGGAFEVAKASIGANADISRDSLSFGESVLSKAISFASKANEQSQEAVADTNRQFTNKFSEFANRQTASSDQKVTDLAKWGIGAMVAVTAWNVYNRRKGA
ncbi:hypothetical protein [Marinobacter sp.]|uniref:hypothetical protein n=1 Tax=Marinobacter sp. TaxID=50741 RepID=UPI0035C74604